MSAAGPHPYDVVVIGAGAAGMMCAARAGQRGRRVLLIEHYHRLGEKIRISGGGRCNFTNRFAAAERYLSADPSFARPALARFSAADFVTLVERHGIAYHEKKLGQLFCDGSAAEIIAMLRSECDRGRVEWRMPCAVADIERQGSGFAIATSAGTVHAAAVVIATGGLTVPKIGATPFGYRIAERFGIAVVAPRPALVPLAFHPDFLARYGDLAGVSLEATVSCGAGLFREDLLFTHRGLSGPAILQISSFWQGGATLHIDLLPELDAAAWLHRERHATTRLDSLLARHVPRRFAQRWCEAEAASGPVRDLAPDRRDRIARDLNDWRVVPAGTLGYQKAEVTLGGVDTRELDPATLCALKVPGLHFVGEVVDVTGWLGGYNFQWAWSSAVAAADAL